MTSAKLNSVSALAADVLRPAIVEAKLMTDKHARDPIYVATLAEELRAMEGKLSAMEKALRIEPAVDCQAERGPCPVSQADQTARWIKAQACKLDLRLRSIEMFEQDWNASLLEQPPALPTASTHRVRRRRYSTLAPNPSGGRRRHVL